MTLHGKTGYDDDADPRVLPPTLNVYAGNDIFFLRDFALAPSNNGNLALFAVRDINGMYVPKGTTAPTGATIVVPDINPSDVYTSYDSNGNKVPKNDRQGASLGIIEAELFDRLAHATIPVHLTDPVPITVEAGRDIPICSSTWARKPTLPQAEIFRTFMFPG